jgi:hypothetical protein
MFHVAAEEDAKWNPQKEKKKEAPAAPVSDDLFKFVGQLEEPTYRIEDTAAKGAEALAVIVQLPKIERMSQLHLDVLEDSLQVRCIPHFVNLTTQSKGHKPQSNTIHTPWATIHTPWSTNHNLWTTIHNVTQFTHYCPSALRGNSVWIMVRSNGNGTEL